jgi:hypothetical protein
MSAALPFSATDRDPIEIAVCDIGLARALWEGVPAARLLARARVGRDEADLVGEVERASGLDIADSTWDKLMARLLARSPSVLDRVKRAVARHTRAASDEGPLHADDATIAALVHVLLSATDPDASSSEGAAEALVVEEEVRRACAVLDERLGVPKADRRATAFEACMRFASSASIGPFALSAVREALGAAMVASASPLYPWGDDEVRIAERRACLVDRADLERGPTAEAQIARDVAQLLSKRGVVVLFSVIESRAGGEVTTVPPSSWLPADFVSHDAAQRLAAALERGATTVPRARAVVARGGDAAVDAIGKEMLEVASHPFASSVFAELIAQIGRDRDVVRLVGYFAIAPDPVPAARALSLCQSREVPTMLRAWLESMLPADAAPPSAHLAACLAALEPFPTLHAAVSQVLDRATIPE